MTTLKTTFFIFLLSFFSFNSTAQSTVQASDIMKDLKKGKTISYTNMTIVGVLDFTFMEDALPTLPNRKRWWNKTGDNKIEKQIDSKISFVNCIFKDDVLAYIPDNQSGYTFTASFKNSVTFKQCTFQEKAMFKYSAFEEDTNFNGTKFNDDSTFKYAVFEKRSSFLNTLFREISTFKYTKFYKNVSFKNSVFKDSAIFKYTEFKKGVSFNSTVFEEDLNLKYTQITGEFDITNMKVAATIDSKYTEINGKSFSKYLIEKN